MKSESRVRFFWPKAMCLGLGLGTCVSAFGQSGELSLKDILDVQIQVSSMEDKNVFKTPSTVSVIDAATIKRFGLTSVPDAIEHLAGVSVWQTYFEKDVAMFRGVLSNHYNNKVLYMINGVANWTVMTGGAYFDRIDINDVERIEVLKGPSSVLYGTNAYSGAINVVLKSKGKTSMTFHGGVGTRDAMEGGGHFYVKTEDGHVMVAANARSIQGKPYIWEDEGKTATTSGTMYHMNDAYSNRNFTMEAQNGDHKFLFNFYQIDTPNHGVVPLVNSGTGENYLHKGYLASYVFEKKFMDDKLYLTNKLIYDHGTKDYARRSWARTSVYKATVQAGQPTVPGELTTVNVYDNQRTNEEGYRLVEELKLRYKFNDSFGTEVGGDSNSVHGKQYATYDAPSNLITSHTNLRDRKTSISSFFAQVDYSSESFETILGVRRTSSAAFEANTSTRLSSVYSFNKSNSMKFIYGESYRVPSLFELYVGTPNNSAVFGTPNLAPETSRSFELAYLTSFDNLFVQLLAYKARYQSKIYRTKSTEVDETREIEGNSVPVKVGTDIYANGRDFSAEGMEIEIKYLNADMFAFFLNGEGILGDNGDEENDDNNYNFRFVPESMWSFGLSKGFHSYTAALLGNYRSRLNGPVEKIDPVTVYDLNLSKDSNWDGYAVTHAFAIKNLSDKQVEYPEIARQKLNSIPGSERRSFMFSVTASM